ncbi:Uncharacterised protein [Mycobacterium tuberculosis]|uniref:Uncharacterized protein n=1 Tax=Mycobacterium tuberculosis TaxID=1773 RepID=A0A654TU18_MYCTX|nr:Uncharacterised protein [Mycobacterium tuberculosis]CKT53072.1 Uncharacterised protein [Mycobacterium tuberculosis]COV30900.1 Uncharacterised protein [Mycobacterium tuberculosis]COZ75350.1 Uncharacterised protein [Mycobacterium tuberculosis]
MLGSRGSVGHGGERLAGRAGIHAQYFAGEQAQRAVRG